MFQVTAVWSFFSWLFVGLWASATSIALIGDLTMLHWIPQLTKASWMLNPRPKQLLWIIAHSLASVAHWFIWKDNGGWPGALGPLLIGFIFMLFTIIWHFVLYWLHQIRASFWVSIIMAALALATTIWFWILGTTPGLLMLFVLIWIFYIALWSFRLTQLNTVAGRVRRTGTQQTLVLQQETDQRPIPPPSVWSDAGRRCPFERQYQQFQGGSQFQRGPAYVRPGDAVNIYGPSGAVQQQTSQQQQNQQRQQGGSGVNQRGPAQVRSNAAYVTDIESDSISSYNPAGMGGNAMTFGQFSSQDSYNSHY